MWAHPDPLPPTSWEFRDESSIWQDYLNPNEICIQTRSPEKMNSCCFQDALYAGRLHLRECFSKMWLQWAKGDKPEKRACFVSGMLLGDQEVRFCFFLHHCGALPSVEPAGAPHTCSAFPLVQVKAPLDFAAAAFTQQQRAGRPQEGRLKCGEGRGMRRSEMIQWLRNGEGEMNGSRKSTE